jgi:hypothetical protein
VALIPIVGLLIVLAMPVLQGSRTIHPVIPLEGMARLKAALPSGRIYNFRQWGGPLIWAGYPGWQVAIDGRLYLYGKEEWDKYNRAALGQIPVDQLVEEHRPDAFFLRPIFQKSLITLLKQTSAWQELYEDTSCSIFVRASGTQRRETPSSAVRISGTA